MVDVSCRHIAAPSRGVPAPGALAQWWQVQERDKLEKYEDECKRLGLNLAPFIMNLWGGVAPQGTKICAQLLKVILGHAEGWTRIQRACEFYQRLSLSLLSAVGKQLRPLAAAGGEGSVLEDTRLSASPEVWVHQPYAINV